MKVDLESLTQCGLIIPAASGVFYTQQCQGTACDHREMEGVLIPIDYDYWPHDYSSSLAAKITDLFPEGTPGELTLEIAEKIQNFLVASPFTRSVKVDFSRLDNSVEAWLYVLIQPSNDGPLLDGAEASAVLTWPNSD